MKISVILPCKNQSEKLLRNLPKILDYFDKQTNITYDVLIQSDHSTKEQNEILLAGIKKFPAHVKVLPFPVDNLHCGKGAAVKEGILATSSDYCMFMDVDLATDLKAFDKAYPLLNKYDAIIASRELKDSEIPVKQPLLRQLTHKGSIWLIRAMFHLKGITDTQCGYKIFKTSVAKEMAKVQIVDKFAFDVEYLYYLQLNNYKVKEIGVKWSDDDDSSVSLFSATKAFWMDLFRIKKNKKNYIK